MHMSIGISADRADSLLSLPAMFDGGSVQKVTLIRFVALLLGGGKDVLSNFLPNQFGKHAKFMVTQVIDYLSLPPILLSTQKHKFRRWRLKSICFITY